jgi:hypothetical protein
LFLSIFFRDLTGIYYLLELAYNIHMLITVFVDVKRKDFAEYIIHHFATVFLIVFSYTVGFVKEKIKPFIRF